MRKQVILLIALLTLTGAKAEAIGLFLGPAAGYQKSQDADSGVFFGGAALRLKLTQSLGAEASILYRQEEFGDQAVTVRSWPVMATGFFYPLPYLYGSVGGGWFYTTFDYSSALNQAGTEDDTSSQFGWHFGGGLEVPLGDKVRLTGDIRYVFIDYDFQGLPGRDVNSNFYMITLGVLFPLFDF